MSWSQPTLHGKTNGNGGSRDSKEGQLFQQVGLWNIVREQLRKKRKISERSSVMPSATSCPPHTCTLLPSQDGRHLLVSAGWGHVWKGNRNAKEREDHSQISVQQKAGGAEEKNTRKELALEDLKRQNFSFVSKNELGLARVWYEERGDRFEEGHS